MVRLYWVRGRRGKRGKGGQPEPVPDLVDNLGVYFAVRAQFVQRSQHDELGIDFEKVAEARVVGKFDELHFLVDDVLRILGRGGGSSEQDQCIEGTTDLVHEEQE
jgi:hypothetical protein